MVRSLRLAKRANMHRTASLIVAASAAVLFSAVLAHAVEKTDYALPADNAAFFPSTVPVRVSYTPSEKQDVKTLVWKLTAAIYDSLYSFSMTDLPITPPSYRVETADDILKEYPSVASDISADEHSGGLALDHEDVREMESELDIRRDSNYEDASGFFDSESITALMENIYASLYSRIMGAVQSAAGPRN